MSEPVAGFFSLTEVTDVTEHRAYNEWHQLDHMPEQFRLPGIGFGQRWVATPACRQARAVSTDRFARTHYLTLYLMEAPLADTLATFFALGRELRAVGRFHLHRQTALTGAFDRLASVVAPRVLVSADAVPYRPNLGIHVRIDEVADGDRLDEHAAWLTVEHLPAVAAVPGVAGAWAFARPAAAEPAQRITVAWLDAPPLEVVPAIAALDPAPAESGRVILDGPFERVVPYEWDWFDEDAG